MTMLPVKPSRSLKWKLSYAHCCWGPASNLSQNEKNETYAERSAIKFRELEFESNSLYKVNVPTVGKHKTFTMALAVRIWMGNEKLTTEAINVFTFGAHARKSELVFKQVFEPGILVGVISAKPRDYNPKLWWMYKVGWQWFIFDSLKYLRGLL